MKKYKLTSNTKRKTGFDWMEVHIDEKRLVYNIDFNRWAELVNFDNVGDLPIKSLKSAIRHINNHTEIKSGYKISLVKIVMPENLTFEQLFNNVIENSDKYIEVTVIEVK